MAVGGPVSPPGRVTAGRRLRERLADRSILVVPGVYDALLAHLVAGAGFEAAYVTGSGVSYSTLAAPDIGLVTGTEMMAKVWQIAGAVDLPVIADADTGYGDIPNIVRTVRSYERAGAAAIQLEDQDFPKRCGHYRDKRLVEVPEMLTRLHTALDARSDDDFLVVARTDARASLGLDEALDRACRYAAAGADLVFVEAPVSLDELARIPASVPVPAVANMVEGGVTPPVAAGHLEELGYAVVIYPNALTRAIVHTGRQLLAELRALGSTEGFRDRMVDFATLTELIGGAGLAAGAVRS